MPVKFLFDEPRLKAWLLCRQTYNLVLKCEDAVFAKVGLTTQQHAVLMAIKYIRNPVTPSDIAHWLDRNTNSISLIVDRMEKDGLVKRVRDLRDRRSLRLVMTSKGKEIFGQATMIGWVLVQEILSCLTEEDLETLGNLMERIRGKAFEYINPGKTIEVIKTNEAVAMPRFLAKMGKGMPDILTS
jgi:MarR family 2-MHQ and catechol resistance regulon transcriptional repressor